MRVADVGSHLILDPQDDVIHRRLFSTYEDLRLDQANMFGTLVNLLRGFRENMNTYRTNMRGAIGFVVGAQGCTTVNTKKFIGRVTDPEEIKTRRIQFTDLLGIDDSCLVKCSKGIEVGDSYITDAADQFHSAIMTNATLYAWVYTTWATGRLTKVFEDEEYSRLIRVNGTWIFAHWIGVM